MNPTEQSKEICFSVPAGEYVNAAKLAKYLYLNNVIPEPTIASLSTWGWFFGINMMAAKLHQKLLVTKPKYIPSQEDIDLAAQQQHQQRQIDHGQMPTQASSTEIGIENVFDDTMREFDKVLDISLEKAMGLQTKEEKE